ncbi:flagellar hook assembly protein FlgD [Bradyrhizobium sp. JR3.5]
MNPRLKSPRHPFYLRTTSRSQCFTAFRRLARDEESLVMTVSSATSAAASAASNSSSSSSSSASMGMSSTDFLNLLVSELQNQDPLNATSTTDFINQLTSYANFTEQQSTNASMTSLASSFSSLVTLNSVNYIGHTVEAKTNTAELTNGSATFGYSLTSAASNVAIAIQDSSGNTVWNGKGNRKHRLQHLHLEWPDHERHPAQQRRPVHDPGDRDRLRRKLAAQLHHDDGNGDRDRCLRLDTFAARERRPRQRRQHHRRHVLIAAGVLS